MLPSLSALALALFAPLTPFHGRGPAERCGATARPVSMLLHPDSVDLQRKIRLQLLQRRISSRLSEEGAAVDGGDGRRGMLPDGGDADEPFDAKMQCGSAQTQTLTSAALGLTPTAPHCTAAAQPPCASNSVGQREIVVRIKPLLTGTTSS